MWLKSLLRWLGYLLLAGFAVYLLLVLFTPRADSAPFFETAAARPLVIAHQGGEHLRPSNTMVAFEHAVSLGVDVLEMDIHSTRDGVLVTIHDDTVDRTTNGSGLVREMNSAELLTLDAGHYWTNDNGASYPYRDQSITIATLEALFKAFPTMPMNIEIKQETPSIVQPFCDMLRRHQRTDLTLVASFSQAAMEQFRATCPEVATSLAADEVRSFFYRYLAFAGQTYAPPASAVQVPEFRSGFHILTPRFVQASQRRNLNVHAWTINDPHDMQRMLNLGVDGIITDRPDLLLDLLNR